MAFYSLFCEELVLVMSLAGEYMNAAVLVNVIHQTVFVVYATAKALDVL